MITEKCYLCKKKTFRGMSQSSIQRQKARHLVNDCEEKRGETQGGFREMNEYKIEVLKK